MFLVPPSLLAGTASDKEYLNWIKVCISPIVSAMEVSLNRDLLLPSEQGNRVFCAETSELLKADVETRFKSYEIGIKNAIYQIDEVRHKENLPPLDLKFLKMGLQDVLYSRRTAQEIYTPNTNAKYDINQATDPSQQANQPNVAQGVQTQPNQGGAKDENIQSGTGSGQKDQQSNDNGQKG